MDKDILNTPMPKPVTLHGMDSQKIYLNYRARERFKRVIALCSKYPFLRLPMSDEEMVRFKESTFNLGYDCFLFEKCVRKGRQARWKGIEGWRICATILYHKRMFGKTPRSVCYMLAELGIFNAKLDYAYGPIKGSSLYSKWKAVISKLHYLSDLDKTLDEIGFDMWSIKMADFIYLEDGSFLSDVENFNNISAP